MQRWTSPNLAGRNPVGCAPHQHEAAGDLHGRHEGRGAHEAQKCVEHLQAHGGLDHSERCPEGGPGIDRSRLLLQGEDGKVEHVDPTRRAEQIVKREVGADHPHRLLGCGASRVSVPSPEAKGTAPQMPRTFEKTRGP